MRASGRGQGGEGDFARALKQGGELMAAGRVAEAREPLESALRLQPKNDKAQNLLGLCYFKLGQLERAAEVYELLVRDNPVDPTLRVNLGLVYLKSGALQRAVREFETAIDLAPEHPRAHNYLGLALAQAGEYGRAREHFLQAGSDQMAQRMVRAIAGEPYTAPPSPGPALAPPAARPAAPAPLPPAQLPQLEDSWGAQVTTPAPLGLTPPPAPAPGEVPAPATSPTPPPLAAVPARDELDFGDLDAEPPPAPPTAPPPAAHPPPLAGSSPAPDAAGVESVGLALPEARPGGEAEDGWDLSGLGAADARAAYEEAEVPAPPEALEDVLALQLGAEDGSAVQRPPTLDGLVAAVQLLPEPPTALFAVRSGALSVVVQGEVSARLEGLLSVEGQVDFTPEVQRQGGLALPLPFGEGDAQLMRARGAGVLLYDAGPHTFLPVELGTASTHLREGVVFALERGVAYENEALPVEGAVSLPLVRLAGQGARVLLRLGGPLRSVAVAKGRPVVVPLAHLVGWQGALSPRVVALGGRKASGVELTGEGFALLALTGR
jgi:uncharacterized protein (AIM24 family)